MLITYFLAVSRPKRSISLPKQNNLKVILKIYVRSIEFSQHKHRPTLSNYENCLESCTLKIEKLGKSKKHFRSLPKLSVYMSKGSIKRLEQENALIKEEIFSNQV